MAFDPTLAALVKQFVSGDASAFCGIYDRLLETGDPRFLDFNYQLHRFCDKDRFMDINPFLEVRKLFPRELMDDPSAQSMTAIVEARINSHIEWEKRSERLVEARRIRSKAHDDRVEYFRNRVIAGTMTPEEMISALNTEFPEFISPMPMMGLGDDDVHPMIGNAVYNGEIDG